MRYKATQMDEMKTERDIHRDRQRDRQRKKSSRTYREEDSKTADTEIYIDT